MKEKELVGKVNDDEQSEIKKLYERKNGLIELSKILSPDNDALYDKVIKDLGSTSIEFDNWWKRMSSKYQWKSKEGFAWEIDFENGNIYLREEKG